MLLYWNTTSYILAVFDSKTNERLNTIPIWQTDSLAAYIVIHLMNLSIDLEIYISPILIKAGLGMVKK